MSTPRAAQQVTAAHHLDFGRRAAVISGGSDGEEAGSIDELDVIRSGHLMAARARERHAKLLAASGVAREDGGARGIRLAAIPTPGGLRESA